MATYTILTSNVEKATKKISTIINKCKKQGVPYTFEVGNPYEKIVESKDKRSHFSFNVTDITLDVQFRYNGWNTLGMVQRKDGITQCYFDSEELIREYKDTDFHCDHCMKRVFRNSVTILEHEDGRRKVVGTSCVKEFTDGLDGNLIASYYSLTDTFEDFEQRILESQENEDMEFFGAHGVRVFSVNQVVSSASRVIAQYGFEPSCGMNATCKIIPDFYDEGKELEEEALFARAWIMEMREEEYTKSSYLFNLRQVIEAGYCTKRHFGLLASLIPAYHKAMIQKAEEARNKPVSSSEYVGEVGEKVTLDLTYTNSYSYESAYGGGFFHLFTDSSGNVFKWSTTKGMRMGFNISHEDDVLDRGSVVRLTGTVKGHEEYRGVKQTMLTRCKYEVIASERRDFIERLAKEGKLM